MFGQAILAGDFQSINQVHGAVLVLMKSPPPEVARQSSSLDVTRGTRLLHRGKDAVIILVAFMADVALLDRLADQAARIIAMGAVAKFAAPQVATELNEAPGDAFGLQMPQRKFADPGGVDQNAAAGEVIKMCRGGGVLTQPRDIGDFTGQGGGFRHQAVDQRRLADPGLPDEDVDLVLESSLQLIHPFAALTADQQHLVADLPILS